MIKANELRIGNWVYLGSHIEQVVDVMCDSVNCRNSGGTLESIEPIPLTPEILEKCGFEHKSANEYVKGNLVFRSRQNDLILHGLEYDYNGVILPRPDSLHQLQNLYFALTGEELTYTP